MELSESQRAAVASWVSEGRSLSAIQSSLQEEFGVKMTYMDVRFLVDDLQLDLKDQPKKAAAKDLQANGADEEPVPFPGAEKEPAAPGGAPGQGGGDVSVSIDKVKRPGALVSGNVTFSDGVTAQWYVDEMGRLGLNPSQEGYQPNQEDVQSFQMELSRLLQSQGF